MSSDDQHFLDILSSIPTDVQRYSREIAESIERHLDSASASIKQTLWDHGMLPASARPPPPPASKIPKAIVPVGFYQRAHEWVSRNRALTAALFAFLGTGGYLVYKKRKVSSRKRRARRATNGARREVVVIAGSSNSLVTRSLASDLERRGFIVYIVVATREDEQAVQNESRVDIRPLHLDVTNPVESRFSLDRFAQMLRSPQHAFVGASPHNLDFKGLVLIPDFNYPSGPVETITPEVWSDALNTRVLGTIATAQAFLRTICDFKARLVIATPTVAPSLKLPFHGVETTIVSAIEGFGATLKGELATQGVRVITLKLGAFSSTDTSGHHPVGSPRETVFRWPPALRQIYTQNYFLSQAGSFGSGVLSAPGRGIRGAPLRELHNAVFEAVSHKRPRGDVRVGKGSLLYALVGAWVPSELVGWMVGLRKVGEDDSRSDERYATMQQSIEWEKVERDVRASDGAGG